MPRAKPSSREDEDLSDEVTERGSSRFQCPPDFVSFRYKPCSSALNISDSELWLIKAPAAFDPHSFSGVQLPLRGLDSLSVPSSDGTERSYNVLSSDCRPELRLLAPPSSLAPPFAGLISVSERHVDLGGGRDLHVVPAVPPPALPPGLKQRFQVCSQRAEPEAEPKRKRRRERKEATPSTLLIKTEIKAEPLDADFGETPEVKKKKKKKKKSKSSE